MNIRNFGWISPASVGRTYAGVSHAPSNARDTLPPAVLLKGVPHDVFDQGAVGSCVAQALAQSVRIVLANARYEDDVPSRKDVYYRARAMEGTTGLDHGCLIADGVKALRAGWLPEAQWPHKPVWGPQWMEEPPPLPADAPRVVNAEALAIEVDAILWEIASGHPVVVGISIPQSFEQATGDVIEEPWGYTVGGHAMLVVGYDIPMRCVRIVNSWNSTWCDGGSAWLPWEYLAPAFCGEAWAVRAVRRLAATP